MMTDEQILKRYGQPGWDNLVDVYLPFEMVIAWDQSITVNRFKAHFRIKDNLEAALDCVLHAYGIERIKELNIDQFGGCYNFRKMRGGSRWSRHSWGIAIDLFPQKNGLRTKAPKAAFSGPEYAELIDIFYEHNFINYGVEKDYDWMHFEIKD